LEELFELELDEPLELEFEELFELEFDELFELELEELFELEFDELFELELEELFELEFDELLPATMMWPSLALWLVIRPASVSWCVAGACRASAAPPNAASARATADVNFQRADMVSLLS
jgi:hypothetical protein